jgi:CRP-like cAMP-binding protein
MVSGEAEAWWQPPEGPRRLLEKRGPGSVFGEIGLMTGAPRRATVIASTDVETYRLDKEGFQAIIEQRPELADSLSGILERRCSALPNWSKATQPARTSWPNASR